MGFAQTTVRLLMIYWLGVISVSAAGKERTNSVDNDARDIAGRDMRNEWKLVKKKSGIQIYSKPAPRSPIDAIRAEVVVDSRLNRLVSILYDPQLRPQWDELCGESYVYEAVSSTEYLAYNHSKLPWPIKDRDMLARVIWSQDSETLKVLMQSTATADLMPRHKDRVRVITATESLELIEIELVLRKQY